MFFDLVVASWHMGRDATRCCSIDRVLMKDNEFPLTSILVIKTQICVTVLFVYKCIAIIMYYFSQSFSRTVRRYEDRRQRHEMGRPRSHGTT